VPGQEEVVLNSQELRTLRVVAKMVVATIPHHIDGILERFSLNHMMSRM
jgi:hypothetical protein